MDSVPLPGLHSSSFCPRPLPGVSLHGIMPPDIVASHHIQFRLWTHFFFLSLVVVKSLTIKYLLKFFVLFLESRITPVPEIGLWTFAPAFSPRFYSNLSPRSIFYTSQRFPFQKHVTSGSMSPRFFFTPGQRF